MRKLLVFAFGTLLTTLWLLPAARADGIQSWSFTFTGNGVSGSGTMTSDPLSDAPPGVLGFNTNVYLVTSIDGTIDGLSATEITGNQYSVIQQWDGTYNPTPLGLHFITSDGPGYDTLLGSTSGQFGPVQIEITPIPAPEPSVLVLLSIGFLGICLVLAATKKT